MTRSKITINHLKILNWVTRRGGRPVALRVVDRAGRHGGLHLDFTNRDAFEWFEPISWTRFFDRFEKERLAFFYQEGNDNGFCKLISRDSSEGIEGF